MLKRIEDDFRKIDRFLYLTKTIDKFKDCKDIYELFGITDKEAPHLEIEAKISGFVNKYQRMHGKDYEHLQRTVSGGAATIKRILKENKKEFDQYLKEKDKKELVKLFEFATQIDKQLQPDEEENLIIEGKKLGFVKSEVINFIDELLQSYKVRRGTAAEKVSSVEALAGKYYEILNILEDADYKKI
ncbi:MAG: hypothetical protein U9N34_04355, partial [Candidatus Cloacimonadota bacterium]|nr:hypothetical protein [Candidatus Cloacimonadota bacterium]